MAEIKLPKFAFPCSYTTASELTVTDCGLMMRDYFAAASLQGFRASCPEWSSEKVARYAYEDADAMVAEFEKRADEVLRAQQK